MTETRKKLGRPGKWDWKKEAETIDWDEKDEAIAAQYGVSRSTVHWARTAYGRPRAGARVRYDWAEESLVIDWDRTNAEIAREYKVSGVHIGNVRKKHGRPRKCVGYYAGAAPSRDWETELKDVDWDRTDVDIAGDFGVAVTTIGKYREMYGRLPRKAPTGWSGRPRSRSRRKSARQQRAIQEMKEDVPDGPWQDTHNGKTWEDMPGDDDFDKRVAFFFFRRGMHSGEGESYNPWKRKGVRSTKA